MRKSILVALAVMAGILVVACSSSSSSGGGAGGLTGKTWQLTAITELTPAFQGVVPTDQQANYTIEFKSDGTFAAKADCNNVSGTYTTTSAGAMTIAVGPSTMAACPTGSMSSQYIAGLGNAASYAIANSALTLTLKDSGTLVFK